jgi:hypothetical protein
VTGAALDADQFREQPNAVQAVARRGSLHPLTACGRSQLSTAFYTAPITFIANPAFRTVNHRCQDDGSDSPHHGNNRSTLGWLGWPVGRALPGRCVVAHRYCASTSGPFHKGHLADRRPPVRFLFRPPPQPSRYRVGTPYVHGRISLGVKFDLST